MVVAGASPAQFPGRLLPGSDERDLADLDLSMGEETDERGADPQER